MKLFVLASLCVSIARAGDVDEHLTKEAEADSHASDDVSCWCKKFRQTLDDQDRERQDEVRFLESIKERTHYSNQRVGMEVADHRKELANHESSLGATESLENRASDKHAAEATSKKSDLDNIRKAIDALPKGSSRAALRGVEKKLQDHLQDANAAQDRSQGQMNGLRKAKTDMARLEHRAVERKTQRYAEGLTIVAQAGEQIAAYRSVLDTDASLKASVDHLCDRLSSGASERHRLRQQAMIASADANFKRADHAAKKAAYKLVALGLNVTSARDAQKHEDKHSDFQGAPCSEAELEQAEDDERRAVASLKVAKTAAGDLNQLLSSSSDKQARLKALFHTIAMDEYLISSRGGVGEGVKAALEKIAAEAKDMDSKSPALFDKVRSAGKASMLKHARLVTSLFSIKADLTMKRIQCKR